MSVVSTHSRLKAAGIYHHRHHPTLGGFNTQPPEGGWAGLEAAFRRTVCFNTQPPEGGWRRKGKQLLNMLVSTPSRLKAAGYWWRATNRPTACFNTQPPEGGWGAVADDIALYERFNTQPPEGGWVARCWTGRGTCMFQHTAA